MIYKAPTSIKNHVVTCIMYVDLYREQDSMEFILVTKSIQMSSALCFLP